MAQQLPFDLPHRPAQDRESFLVSPCNAQAVSIIDAWPSWTDRITILVGAAATGKSHLAAVWQARAAAPVLAATQIVPSLPQLIGDKRAIAIDGLEGLVASDEEALFHLINAARHDGFDLLLTSQVPVSELDIALADLKSRLMAAHYVTLGAPDDALLQGLLVKLMLDRQLDIDPETIAYVLSRIERRCDAVAAFCQALDRRSLSEKRPITRRLAADVLALFNDEEG